MSASLPKSGQIIDDIDGLSFANLCSIFGCGNLIAFYGNFSLTKPQNGCTVNRATTDLYREVETWRGAEIAVMDISGDRDTMGVGRLRAAGRPRRARPGGNVTGLSSQAAELGAKRISCARSARGCADWRSSPTPYAQMRRYGTTTNLPRLVTINSSRI